MLTHLWYSERARSWLIQGLLLGGVACFLYWVCGNTAANLAARGIRVGYEFLWRTARFPISESVIPYSPADTFLWAFVVGIANTLFISLLAIVSSTVVGLLVALARRSGNPLLAGITGGYVTAVRNTPLIVQLLFWYALATTALPAPRNAFNPIDGVFISLRGIFLPQVHLSGDTTTFAALALSIIVVTTMMVGIARRWNVPLRGALVMIAVVTALGAVAAVNDIRISVSTPELRGLNFVGGFRLSSEFTALMLGLVIYTSAFIGEIIRGGIDAIGKGQWEAARALGLNERKTLSRIIIPQALRIIIPPLTTQYLSTVKNTTLALAVGYPELGLIVGTVINQTGQAIESIVIMLAVFLTISIAVSLVMNRYNRKIALVQP
ncbi:ABC transporter permease subunit [Bradyrhizobium sp. LHD-71]|uniref:amino acid ABC transporter permease n=1 Tax=Bradyrhizobium sp. LHD-71 TaxID=3072141 RepID=UPI00280E3483|nr:ABC transporter permease subunit [Bradyrhizobium sp. LHD-71]MDQ8732548.1 ABC transporter permease subunit [Bradyrhizobium sp. LHD-71]